MLTKEERKEVVHDLRDVQEMLREALGNARDAIEGLGIIKDRAESYWIHQLASIIGDEEGGNPYDESIESTIEEVNETEEENN